MSLLLLFRPAAATSSPPVHSTTQVAGPSVGSSDPTYHTNSKRACLTAGGRILATHGKHTDGTQLVWRDPGGAWSTVTRGDVTDGRIISGQGTGDIGSAIATAKDLGGNEIALALVSGTSGTSSRALQVRRLTDLDNSAGPQTGALITLESGGTDLGSGKVDVGKERTSGGVERLCAIYTKQTATTTMDVRYGWVTDLTTDTVAFSTTGNLVTASTSFSKQLNIIEKPAEAFNGLGIISRNQIMGTGTRARLLQRSSADAPTVFTEGTAATAGAGASASYCNGVRLGTEWLTVQMANTTTGVCVVDRFNDAGSSQVLDMTTAVGYWDPLVTTDGTKAYLFMRKGTATTSADGGSDDVIVKYEYTPGVGWGSESTVMEAGLGGSFGVGGYIEPNGVRNTTGSAINWALFVPASGVAASQSAVYALVEETASAPATGATRNVMIASAFIVKPYLIHTGGAFVNKPVTKI